jgi:glucose-6-phosphate isomerase
MEINLKNKTPDIRHLNDMKEVLYDQEWVKTAPNYELYYMYRGLKEENGLRYDITIIPARMLGKEYVKTKGHYHVHDRGELYVVLEGEGIFLLQKEEKGQIIDAYYIRGEEGDFIPIPPQYGHITINPSNKDLKMANWVSKKCKSDYSCIGQMKGACYYYLESGWVKNKNYNNVPNLSSKEPLKNKPNLDFLKLK